MGALYVGVSSKARKVKKLYVGVSGKARKVKKLYVGVSGKARLVYRDELSKHANASALTQARVYSGAASVGNYAVIGGGQYNNSSKTGYSDVTNAYNTSLTRSTPTALSKARDRLAAAKVGSYAVFAGGHDADGRLNIADAYNTSLTESTPTRLGLARYNLGGASVGNYAVFAGGQSSTNVVQAYNTSLTLSNVDPLQTSTYSMAAITVGNYALFCGGYGVNKTTAYNTSLTRSYPADCNVGGIAFGAVAGNYGIITHSLGTTSAAKVDTFNTSLTHGTAPDLSVARSHQAASSVGDYAAFAGGYQSASGGATETAFTTVDVYDTSLTHTLPDGLDEGRLNMTGVSVGNYALFAGGYKTRQSVTYAMSTVFVYEA